MCVYLASYSSDDFEVCFCCVGNGFGVKALSLYTVAYMTTQTRSVDGHTDYNVKGLLIV